jgi:spore germination protein Q
MDTHARIVTKVIAFFNQRDHIVQISIIDLLGGFDMYWPYPYGMISSQPTLAQQEREMKGPMQPPIETEPLANFPYSEQAYQANIGKTITAYMTYEGSVKWLDMKFTGPLLQVGRDYLIIHNNATNRDVILFTINLNFIEFEPGESAVTPPGVGSPFRRR